MRKRENKRKVNERSGKQKENKNGGMKCWGNGVQQRTSLDVGCKINENYTHKYNTLALVKIVIEG